jgi:hypothetical protein
LTYLTQSRVSREAAFALLIDLVRRDAAALHTLLTTTLADPIWEKKKRSTQYFYHPSVLDKHPMPFAGLKNQVCARDLSDVGHGSHSL